MEIQKTERLGSLDILRGFDLFCLVFFSPLLRAPGNAMDVIWQSMITSSFDAVAWEFFILIGLIIPLFITFC